MRCETIKHAYKNSWLREEPLWIDMLDDRNRTSDIYSEEMANEIYDHIKEYYKELAHTYQFLAKRFQIFSSRGEWAISLASRLRSIL